jgi:aconitate decarboxylase
MTTTTTVRDLAAEYAAPALDLRYDRLSPETVAATRDALFDTLAVSLGGLTAPGVPEARQAIRTWGTGSATLWGGFGTAPAPFAALANAGALHALDYDDTDDAVPLHANSVLLPALLADIEQCGDDVRGQEFLTSLAAGIDAAMRIGRAGGPRGSRGWNYSVISGGYGAVLGLARQRRWDLDTTVDALGHQLAQTSGSLQSIIDGSLAKRFQPAMVSKDVLVSIALAGAGVDGPRNVFEGRAGFFNLYQDGAFDREVLVRGAEEASLVVDLSLKPYPACRFTHACIDVALRMREAGVDPAEVERIVWQVSGQAVNMVGRDFDPATANIVDAQFSIAYTTSVGLHHGAVLIGDFDPQSFRDSAAGAFARDRMSIEADESTPFLAMAPVKAMVTTRDGRVSEYRGTTVSGSPEARLDEAQLKAKAADCLNRTGAPVAADELWDAVAQLQDNGPVEAVLNLLKRSGVEA